MEQERVADVKEIHKLPLDRNIIDKQMVAAVWNTTTVQKNDLKFYLYWEKVNFSKKTRAEKGTKKNEVERAKTIANIIAEKCLKADKRRIVKWRVDRETISYYQGLYSWF